MSMLMFQFTSAVPFKSLITQGNISRPDEDPFYIPKEGYEKLKLGEVINYRKLTQPLGILYFEMKVESTYQFLVRSEDSFGNPNAIVTTVMVPHNADPSKILSYQAAVDAADPNCAPSYALQLGSDPGTWLTTNIEQLFSQAGLYEGWIVVIPDFLGPKSAFCVGLQAAHATLNSLRAVTASGDITGVNKDAEIVLWGYSGGTQPTVWSATLFEQYAPELNIIGAAAGGVLVNPNNIAHLTMGGIFSGLVVNAINGFGNEYGDLNDFIKDNIYKEVQDKFFKARTQCLVPSLIETFYTTWEDISPLGDKLLEAPLFKKYIEINNLLNLNATPSVPFFFYNSQDDEIIPPADADDLYDKWCAQGVTIEYHQDEIGEHITQAVAGSGLAFNWIKRRLTGATLEKECKKTISFSNILNLEGFGSFAEILGDALSTIHEKEIGPKSPTSSVLISNTTVTHKSSSSSSASTIVASKTSSNATSTATSSSLLGSLIGLIF
ncbi:LIP-domain-containing protein [Suhomyces tanzawaensis NRRL Y-17324]|uniref:LIP-domain-containing protein n=1 Tax=Suhomyces tanzawaensis NRRL Y-17324 TaxID=984487 RepID=A0A1E4SLG5_9ASCO|nr:LIP-domain-containing protein [Suhomyces tanzawaensis NRRL Y-17324]ODV80340.1 LIP-domain-containing protein [Suhomyces tanzawaensis NRRL Y-17324]